MAMSHREIVPSPHPIHITSFTWSMHCTEPYNNKVNKNNEEEERRGEKEGEEEGEGYQHWERFGEQKISLRSLRQ